jgi:hypothetical protein
MSRPPARQQPRGKETRDRHIRLRGRHHRGGTSHFRRLTDREEFKHTAYSRVFSQTERVTALRSWPASGTGLYDMNDASKVFWVNKIFPFFFPDQVP